MVTTRVEVVMLQLGQPLGDPAGVVVVDQGDDAHRLGVVGGDDLLDQGGAHQAADGLAPVGVAMLLAIAVELVEQLAADRHAEPDQRAPSRRSLRRVGLRGCHGIGTRPRAVVDHSGRGDPMSRPLDAPSILARFRRPSTLDPCRALELATAASMNAIPATPSTIPGCSNGASGPSSPSLVRMASWSVMWRFASASWKPFGVARGDADVGLDRGREVAVLGAEAVELDRLAPLDNA